MNYEIPVPLKQEHDALHDQLRQARQAGGEVGVLALTDRLEAELPAMLAEHHAIVEALQRLRDAAQRD